MSHIFEGRLCGLICADCPEPLGDVVVRLYRLRDDQRPEILTAAKPSDTIAVVEADAVEAKASALIAETRTDADGAFTFELGENDRYDGGAFELDVVCATVMGATPTDDRRAPVQFTVTTLAPEWRQRGDDLVWYWEYCLPYRFWCWLRGLFGAWTICGRVTVCETKAPVGGVRVFALDADWTQHDALGSALTDATGRFRIDYSSADFAKTPFSPWLNVELVGGPDLFYRVETPAGAVLLAEPASRGRQPDRENAGACTCVELCLDDAPPIPPPYPVFRYVGGYNFVTQIDSAPAGDGLTLADDRAFYSTLRLNGILSKRLNGNPMEYRFEWRELPAGAWAPVPPALVARTVIGLWEHLTGDPINPVETKEYTVNGTAGPGELVAPMAADGWIQVPQESDFVGPEGYFSPNGDLINLLSQSLVAWGSIDVAGITAGNPTAPAGLASDRFFGIRMRCREVGNPATEINGGELQRLAVDNTDYDNVTKGGTWAPSTVPNQLGVAMVDLDELVVGGSCVEIDNSLNVRYTAAHPNLGSVGVTMTGPGGPYAFTLVGPVTPDTFGIATPSGFVVADLEPCAYIVTLTANLLLTTGDSSPLPLHDQLAFCKA